MEVVNGGVYLITCVRTRKRYVGIWTTSSFDGRWKTHLKSAKSGVGIKASLQAAIREFGPNAFKREIIQSGKIPFAQLCAAEVFWIGYYGTKVPTGYNLTDGGDAGLGRAVTKEQKEKRLATWLANGQDKKQSERMKGRKQSEAQRAKILATWLANGQDKLQSERLKGRALSWEHRQKISVARKGKKFSEQHRRNLGEAHRGAGRGNHARLGKIYGPKGEGIARALGLKFRSHQS